MNKSYSKIRHIQNSNILLEKRLFNEKTNFLLEDDNDRKNLTEKGGNPNDYFKIKEQGVLVSIKNDPVKIDDTLIHIHFKPLSEIYCEMDYSSENITGDEVKKIGETENNKELFEEGIKPIRWKYEYVPKQNGTGILKLILNKDVEKYRDFKNEYWCLVYLTNKEYKTF